MHEQSETYQGDDGQYYVGYGRGTGVPGERLPGSPNFPSPEAAEPWAVQRSKSTPRDAEKPLNIQRAWERAAGGGTSPMQVKPQSQDQVGATPLSWNSQDAVEKALQDAKSSTYKALVPPAKAYLNWRAQQIPTVESVSQGNLPVGAGAMGQIGRGWTGPVGQQLEKLLGSERMARLANATGKVDLTDFSHPGFSPFQNRAYGVTLPEEYLRTGNPNVLNMIKGPQDNTIAIGPLAQKYNVVQQTGLHEAVDHAIPLAEGTGHMMVPGEAKNVFVGEYRNPTIDLHSPEYLTRLQQWYRSQGRGGTPHAAGDVVANTLASQGGFQPLDRSISLPILNRPLHERILNEIQQTGSYR